MVPITLKRFSGIWFKSFALTDTDTVASPD